MDFRIPHQQEFQFVRERKPAIKRNQLSGTTARDKKKGVSVWDAFLDVLKEI